MRNPPSDSRQSGSSRGRSINERHFVKLGNKVPTRISLRPTSAAARGALTVTFPRKGRRLGADLTLDMTVAGDLPNIAADLLGGFMKASRTKSRGTIQHDAGWLREWCRFMVDDHAQITFEAIDRSHLIAFRAALDNAHEEGQAKRSKKTRSRMINAVQAILLATGKCGHVDFIKRPYKSVDGQNLRSNDRTPPRPVPPTADLKKLLRAVLVEMEDTMTLRAAFKEPAHPANDDPRYANRLSLARHLHDKFGVEVPTGPELREVRTQNVHQRTSATAAMAAFVPTLAAIAPFCIMLMIALRLDGHMLTALRQQNVIVVKHLGVDRLEVKVWRNKVKEWKRMTASLSRHWHSPEKLVGFLDDWSTEARLMSEMPAAVSALQFVARTGGKQPRIRGLEGADGIGRAITDFCNRHDVPAITSSIPRKIAIALGDLLSSGDIAVRTRLGGNSTEVNLRHYDTPETVAQGNDAYGVGLMLQAAHRRDHGRVPDRRHYLPDEDVLAATPGWWCSHPFDPPPGSSQNPLKPCAAYGMCPVCENGEPDLSDPVSCKRVGLLLEAILRSEGNMSPDVWEGTWKPVADELAFKYIPMFEAFPEVIEKASLLDIGPMMEVVRAQNS